MVIRQDEPNVPTHNHLKTKGPTGTRERPLGHGQGYYNMKITSDSTVVIQQRDRRNIQVRLVTLHEQMLGLAETVPSAHLTRAAAILDTALLLESINFDVMLNIMHSIEDAQVDMDLGSTWVQAADLALLANDILADLPISYTLPEPPQEVLHA